MYYPDVIKICSRDDHVPYVPVCTIPPHWVYFLQTSESWNQDLTWAPTTSVMRYGTVKVWNLMWDVNFWCETCWKSTLTCKSYVCLCSFSSQVRFTVGEVRFLLSTKTNPVVWTPSYSMLLLLSRQCKISSILPRSLHCFPFFLSVCVCVIN